MVIQDLRTQVDRLKQHQQDGSPNTCEQKCAAWEAQSQQDRQLYNTRIKEYTAKLDKAIAERDILQVNMDAYKHECSRLQQENQDIKTQPQTSLLAVAHGGTCPNCENMQKQLQEKHQRCTMLEDQLRRLRVESTSATQKALYEALTEQERLTLQVQNITQEKERTALEKDQLTHRTSELVGQVQKYQHYTQKAAQKMNLTVESWIELLDYGQFPPPKERNIGLDLLSRT